MITLVSRLTVVAKNSIEFQKAVEGDESNHFAPKTLENFNLKFAIHNLKPRDAFFP